MAFMSGTTTVTVQAKLTNAGKRKLYESIEGGGTSFITKFGLGDSDSNYVAIDNGSGPLDSGFVPIAGEFQSRPRSHVIYDGIYRPGVPVILHNGDPGMETNINMSISSGEDHDLMVQLETEWPRGESFSESYNIDTIPPTSISDERFEELFTVRLLQDNNNLQIRYNGGANLTEIMQLVGNDASETDFRINITGNQSRRFSQINVRIVY